MKRQQPIGLSADDLLTTIIQPGYCSGCGICAVSPTSPFEIAFNDEGCLEAVCVPKTTRRAADDHRVWPCPFSPGPDEDDLAQVYFGNNLCHDERIGAYAACYVGHVAGEEYRERGSSGGLTSWLLVTLMESGLVDGVVHVRPTPDDSAQLFKYSVSRIKEEILSGAKSHYYPVTMADVLQAISQSTGSFVFVGVPCFIKALRLLMRDDDALRSKIRYTVGLVCGHLKSRWFSEAIAWQCGIPPGELRQIDFRVKNPEAAASCYRVTVSGQKEGKTITVTKENRELVVSDWGIGFFKYSACDFCDDVFAETADITIGDAWLPDVATDWRGTNLIVVRNVALQGILEDACRTGLICLKQETPDRVAASQAGGLRHRREGLAVRLHDAIQAGKVVPQKRVRPHADALPWHQRNIMRFRHRVISVLNDAYDHARTEGRWSCFEQATRRISRHYRRLYRIHNFFCRMHHLRCRVKRGLAKRLRALARTSD